MSVSLLTRMGHLHAAPPSGSEASSIFALQSTTSSSSVASSSTSPPASSSSLTSFSSGSNLPLGNLSLHASQWTSGSGARNSLRNSSPVRPDDTHNSPAMDMIGAQLAVRRACVAAAVEQHQQETGTMHVGKLPIGSSGGNTGSGCTWNPFSLLPFFHGAALASGSSSAPTAGGSASAAVTSESALSAWSAAAAAAAAAAYASLLPSGRSAHDQDAGTRRRGESKGWRLLSVEHEIRNRIYEAIECERAE